MHRPRIIVQDLSKSYQLERDRGDELKEIVLGKIRGRLESHPVQPFWALRDVSFSVCAHEFVGVIGVNGAGKSTLLKCLAGILQPDFGSIRLHGSVATVLGLGAGFHSNLTGRENILLQASLHGLSRREALEHMPRIVDFADLGQFIDQPMRMYSSGMYMRLGFSVAIHIDRQILLIDEVISVGDEAFQAKCLERIRNLRASDRSIILVSHGADTIRGFCDRAMLLDGGRLVADGAPQNVLSEYERLQSTQPQVTPRAD